MHTRRDDTALHAACTHIEDCSGAWQAYQTDGIFDRFKSAPKAKEPGEAGKPSLFARLKPTPKAPGEAAKETGKPTMLARLRAATKSTSKKDGAPADARAPSKGLFAKFFGKQPKQEWDVNTEYLNLTKTYSAAHHYHFGEERTPKYGILFGTNGCKYFRDKDTDCRDDNSYISIVIDVCVNDIHTRLSFHTTGKPTNFAEWQRTSLTAAEFTQIQWIRDPTEYFSSKNRLQKPIPLDTGAATHDADHGELLAHDQLSAHEELPAHEEMPAEPGNATKASKATNDANPYFVVLDNPVEPVSHETVPPLPATPDPPAPAAPVSKKPVSAKPPARPARPRVTKLHLPSETDERYMLTKTRIDHKDDWLGYAWAITVDVSGEKRFAAIRQFDRIGPDNIHVPYVWGFVSNSGLDVAFSLANAKNLVFSEWTRTEIDDIEGLMYIKHPKLYFADIIANGVQ